MRKSLMLALLALLPACTVATKPETKPTLSYSDSVYYPNKSRNKYYLDSHFSNLNYNVSSYDFSSFPSMKANDDNWKAPVSSAYGFEEEGQASWYGPGFEGHKTANGETFRTAQMTAAHKSLPMNSMIEVTNVENGKTAIVRINDRGPYIDGRIIDLSQAAAEEIGMMQAGTASVKIRALAEAEIKALKYAQN